MSLVLLLLSVISVAGKPLAFVGKRGIVYDYTSSDYSKYYVGSKKVAFGSDYHATRGETGAVLDPVFAFISTLLVDGNLQNPTWLSTMKPLITSGQVKAVFASNEPDNAGQANLSPQNAANVYKQYMMPLKGLGAGLGTPAVTNGVGTTGLNYLENFVNSCQGCTFDFINVHHYVSRRDCTVDQAVAAVKTHIDINIPAVQAKHTQLQGLPICIGEFWITDATDAEGADYLRKLLPYLDNHPNVACYQAFGGLWKGHFINQAGNGLTLSGSVYRDY
ncbi:hypothetical protein MMC07_009507 [Pseudocyphellaria aurata]|nr:hypothetical protein [Pseudocyphellaria aurata]